MVGCDVAMAAPTVAVAGIGPTAGTEMQGAAQGLAQRGPVAATAAAAAVAAAGETARAGEQ